jgi:hypothetical protein
MLNWLSTGTTLPYLLSLPIHNVPGGHSIGHAKQKLYVYMCPVPNGFRDRTVSLYRRATRHVLTRVAKCIDIDGGVFVNLL